MRTILIVISIWTNQQGSKECPFPPTFLLPLTLHIHQISLLISPAQNIFSQLPLGLGLTKPAFGNHILYTNLA